MKLVVFPLWAKCLVVFCLGSLAYSLMQAAEFSRQDYEMAVCTTNTTGVDVCQFNSATNAVVPEGSLAVAAMGAAAFLANGFAPPKVKHMREAFVPYHFFMVLIWYFLAWAWTLVPLIYTCYLMWSQATNSGANLYVADPATENQSALLVSLDGPPAYNPCNPNNIYCLSITPGLLAGFGYLFAGATAFWCAWLMMDDTATKILKGETLGEDGTEGAYFHVAPGASARQAAGDEPHISQVR